MTPTPPCAGPDVHRRTVLAGLGLAGGVGALDVLVGGNRVRAATTGGDGNVLVTVFLRGGMDGLSTVVPHGDPGYAAARPTIAVPRTSLLHANATFGLAPAMAALSPLWSAGQVAAVHATGLVTANRSHFEAQALVEEAGLRSYRSGWVNRLTEVLTRPSVTSSVSTTTTTPMAQLGPAPSVGSSGVDGLVLIGTQWGEAMRARRRAQWSALWQGHSSPLADSAADCLVISDAFLPAQNAAASSVTYPAGGIGGGLAMLGRLLRQGVPLSTGLVENAGWDLHVGLGRAGEGTHAGMLRNASESIAAFFTDIGAAAAARTTVVVMSEFGRTTTENGGGGADHGWGSTMLVIGAGVKGGYYSRWPGLSRAADGTWLDLTVTTDYRDVLADVVASRFPQAPLSSVFPGLVRNSLGIMR